MTNSTRIVSASGDLIHWESDDGLLHRIDGPAIEYGTGNSSWYVAGQLCVTAKMYQQYAKLSDEELTMLILKYGDIE